MRRRLMWLVLFSAVIMVTALFHARKVMATPSDGFVSTTLALGRFGGMDAGRWPHPVRTTTAHS